jgi:hypothetical protein
LHAEIAADSAGAVDTKFHVSSLQGFPLDRRRRVRLQVYKVVIAHDAAFACVVAATVRVV